VTAFGHGNIWSHVGRNPITLLFWMKATIWYSWWGIMTLGPYPTYPAYPMGMGWMTGWYFGVSYWSYNLRRSYFNHMFYTCYYYIFLEDNQTPLDNWCERIYSTDQKSFRQGMVRREGPYRCREGPYPIFFLEVYPIFLLDIHTIMYQKRHHHSTPS
jgi:hypothetical protein